MENLKHFNSYINEATAIGLKNVSISKNLEETIKISAALSSEIDREKKEFEQKMKIKETTLKKYEEEIMNYLKSVDAMQIKVGKIVAKINVKKGSITHSYKDLWNYMLTKVNENQRLVALKFQEINQKIHPDKEEIEFVEEGLVSSITNWFSSFMNNFGKLLTGWKEDVDKLEKAVVNLD